MKDNKKVSKNEESMSKIIQINEGEISSHVDGIVRKSVEETINVMLDAEKGYSDSHFTDGDVEMPEMP